MPAKTRKRHWKNVGTQIEIVSNSLFVYYPHAYTDNVFQQISQICQRIPRNKMVLDKKASGRKMHVFSDIGHPIYKLIYNPSFLQKIRIELKNPRAVPCFSIPIEFRVYNEGAYMNWHRDTKMIREQDQYECVLTLTNSSDSVTMVDYGVYKRSISSVPNSVMVVQAHGVRHAVTKTMMGERTIVKFTLVTEGFKCSPI